MHIEVEALPCAAKRRFIHEQHRMPSALRRSRCSLLSSLLSLASSSLLSLPPSLLLSLLSFM